jgi:hypothetical protein
VHFANRALTKGAFGFGPGHQGPARGTFAFPDVRIAITIALTIKLALGS